MKQSDAAILQELGGSAEQISRELLEFEANSRALSADHPRFIDEYPERWVAVYQGHVAASGESLEEAAQDITAKGLPAEHVIIRHITRDQKTYFF